jgi:hypothetical protein
MSLHDTAAEQLTVIVPTLNEAANIRPLLNRIFERDGELDPGSLDIWESGCGGPPAR